MNLQFISEWRLLDYAVCVALGLIALIVNLTVSPHCRTFSFTDASISNPVQERETFPTYSVIIAVALVVLLYVAGEFFVRWKRDGRRRMLRYLNAWVLAQAFSILLQFCIVNMSKLYAGRLRPDFVGLLAAEGITQDNFGNFTAAEVCKAAREGRLSFPSGHSGTVFAGFVPPALYLLGLTRVLRGGSLARATVSLAPLIFCIIVAVSRTRDNDHHFSDILAGSVIGTACALFAVAVLFAPAENGEWRLRDQKEQKEELAAEEATPPPDSAQRTLFANGEEKCDSTCVNVSPTGLRELV